MTLIEDNKVISQAYMTRDKLKEIASAIDSNNISPEAGINLLKRSNLMNLLIPVEFGGGGGGLQLASDVAQILASGCLSTSMMWGMHCQQIMTLIENRNNDNNHIEQTIKNISQNQEYIASVTTEVEKGGDLFSAQSALSWISENEFILDREGPIVTGGNLADFFLITVRRESSSLKNDVLLVLARKNELEIRQLSSWNPLGMRGTNSNGIHLYGKLERANIVILNNFEKITQRTLIPVGHIMWASSWLGATKDIYHKMIRIIRENHNKRYSNKSDYLYIKLSQVRLIIDTVDVYLRNMLVEYEDFRKASYEYPSKRFNININNLKIFASEELFKATDLLMDIAGMNLGYLKNEKIPIERAFRDLRSAKLMYHNDRLAMANGKLSLFDSDLLPR
ncbi:acyl-CoA dehydrogenase family protein [Robertmurraya kyonggiensis]|uniref:Acyl-CoA dehydrogenase n=1 Tax=Robertmurraya kyonggiensis TaxID=1037680 RepID=A0A4U1D9E3_9BACI|nr:acyl-CoA dehydrogenase family protein [Robertmurraya kyonggiensis]TKC19121.1 acyl-CoA dehydrogenase [Robertmurraya kyonggiensis]